jgi:hypothetical protein
VGFRNFGGVIILAVSTLCSDGPARQYAALRVHLRRLLLMGLIEPTVGEALVCLLKG